MILTKDLIQFIVNDVNSPEKIKLREEDYKRFLMYQGKSKGIIEEAIRTEFKKKENVAELMNRIVPLNITEKIINKLAGVYLEDPARRDALDDEKNNLFVATLEEEMLLNLRCKEANRYFKLYKRNLEEYYLSDDGTPQLRNLPRHTYEVYSFNSKQPDIVDVVVKIVTAHQDKKKQKLAIFSNESHIIVNGAGEIYSNEMLAMNNPEFLNPFGKLPFVYTNSVSYSVNPLSDDDLLRMSIVIPLLLSDLLFAVKYQSWAIIYTVGFDGEIPFAPNSVINVQFTDDGKTPEINSVKPDIDSDKIISIVENLISYLLSTKNLSTASIIGKSTDVVSGVSKMLDSAESVEDKKDQQAYFMNAEKDRWYLLSKHLIPFWRENGMLNSYFDDLSFSDDFEVDICFKEPKPFFNEKDKIELSKMKLDAGLTTVKRELKNLYPQMGEGELLELYNEILEEKNEKENGVQSDSDDQSE